MEHLDFEALMRMARRYAVRMKRGQDADDFAQYYALHAFRTGRKTKLQWSLTNYLRETYGDTRSKTRRLALLNTFSLDDASSEDGNLMHEQIAAPDVVEPLRVTVMPRNSRERIMLTMRLDGHLLKDIAKHFGISISRVRQILRRMYASAREYEIAMIACPMAKEFIQKWFTGKLIVGRKKHVRFSSPTAQERRRKTRFYRRAVQGEGHYYTSAADDERCD